MYFFRRNRNAARLSLDFYVGLLIFVLNLHLNCSETVSDQGRSNRHFKQDSDNSIEGPYDTKNLVAIAFVHRHGDRTVGSTYTNDPYKNVSWPGGPGALTRKGARQLYDMGTFLRGRYKRLLTNTSYYSQENMNILSSSVERCLMSAAALEAGFQVPNDCDNLLPFPWQPVPVNSLPAAQDPYLLQFGAPCKNYDALYLQLLTNPPAGSEYAKVNEDLAPLYAYLTKYTGDNVTNVVQVWMIYDTIFVETNSGFEMPSWAKPVYEKMAEVKAIAFRMYTATDYMIQIRGGPLLYLILQRFLQKENGTSTLNISHYSGHETTVINVLRGLRCADQATYTPDYGATLVFELYCPPGDRCYIKVWYYFNTYENRPKQMKLPRCPDPCYLDQFQTAYADTFVSNYTQACGNT